MSLKKTRGARTINKSHLPSVAVLAGGLATRLRPVTVTTPKSLIEVSGKPFIAHQMELLYRKGIRKAVLCVGHLGEQIEDFVKDGSSFGIEVNYSHDGATLIGTGGAVRKALPLLSDPFFVMYGDSYLDISFRAVHDFFVSHRCRALMTVYHNRGRYDSSNMSVQGDMIVRYEKGTADPALTYIDYGLSLMSKGVFSYCDEESSLDLSVIISMLIGNGELYGYPVKRRFYEIGSTAGLKETNIYLERRAAKGG